MLNANASNSDFKGFAHIYIQKLFACNYVYGSWPSDIGVDIVP